MKKDTNITPLVNLSSTSFVFFNKSKFMPTLLFLLICIAVISGCSSTGKKDSNLEVTHFDTVTVEPVHDEVTNENKKLNETRTSKILNIFGDGIKYTLGVLVEGVKGTLSGAAGGVAAGGIGCLEGLSYPALYPFCVATAGVLGAGMGASIGIYNGLTESHDSLFKSDESIYNSGGNIHTCNVYYCQSGACGSSQFRISKITGNLDNETLNELNEILEKSIPEKTHHNCPI